MALITCEECTAKISPKAAACPQCGAPLQLRRKKKSVFKALIELLAIAFFAWYFWVSFISHPSKSHPQEPPSASSWAESQGAAVTPPPPPAPSCKTEWRLCKDNSDLANNYREMSKAQVACKIRADDSAKYGAPEWPWLVFSSFLPGADAPKVGILTLIEKDAKFSNAFGAMQRVTVICVYDFVSHTVTDIQIN